MSKINLLDEEPVKDVKEESFKEKALSPFDYIKSLNEKNYIDVEVSEGYNTFLVNKNFSMDRNTVHLSNTMNRYLDYKFHYDFYYHSLSKKKRYTKWIKGEKQDDLSVIKMVYNISHNKAKIINNILNDEQKLQLEQIYKTNN